MLLLERDRLTSGTTWHAAGLMVTFGSLSETSTELRKYSKELYSRVLPEETGLSCGFMPCGFIELATDAGYLEEFRRVSAFNRKCGIDVQEISAAEVERLFPLCKTDDVLAGFYVADDGRVNPVDATAALARGARMRGVTVCEGVSVAEVLHEGGRVCGVRTSEGEEVRCEAVVNAAGMWARQLGEASGVSIPNQAAEHYYLLTEPMDDVERSWPVVEDPSSHTYIRPEGGGLMVGLFEPDAASWCVPAVPSDFSFGEIEPDWERIAPFLEKAMGRVPRSLETGAKKLFCGPESFTPDLNPVVGEAPELRGYYVAAGMNSIGILTGGGIGRMLAKQIVDGYADMDVTAYLPDRLQPYQTTPAYREARVVESLGKVYKCHCTPPTPDMAPRPVPRPSPRALPPRPTFFSPPPPPPRRSTAPWCHRCCYADPHRPVASARNVRVSPIHNRLAEHGAYFRDVSGWEAADWYAGAGCTPQLGALQWGRHPEWFGLWEAEHRACREAVVLIDVSALPHRTCTHPHARVRPPPHAHARTHTRAHPPTPTDVVHVQVPRARTRRWGDP